MFSEKDKGEPIGVFAAYSDVEEGEIVTNKIAQLHAKSGYAYHDFAILYRTNAQSRILRRHCASAAYLTVFMEDSRLSAEGSEGCGGLFPPGGESAR